MNKRIIIFVGLGVIMLLAGLILGNKTGSRVTTPSPDPVIHYAAPPPIVTLINNAPSQVTFSFSGNAVDAPKILPVYRFSPQTYSSIQLNEVAKKLGFTTKEKQITYGIKSNTVWTEPDKTLSFYSNGQDRVWSYTLFLSPPGKTSSSDLALIAKGFLENLFSSTNKVSLSLKDRTTSQLDDFQVKDPVIPKIQGMTFSSLIEGLYPIVSYQFDQTIASCIIDENGTIRFFSFIPPPLYDQGEIKPIISPQNAIDSLNKGLGILVYAKSQNSPYLDVAPSFDSALLTKYSLVYYPNLKTFMLSPFYIFEGSATTKDGEKLDVHYAVSALEEN